MRLEMRMVDSVAFIALIQRTKARPISNSPTYKPPAKPCQASVTIAPWYHDKAKRSGRAPVKFKKSCTSGSIFLRALMTQ